MSVACEASHRRYNAAMPTLTFHGAARTVTGSKHLLEVDGRRILVDCGQFQGRKDLRLLNWTQFPFDPTTLDAVILTHAHLDHSGLLPRLVAEGYQGRIYCTPGTLELCGLVLPDAGRIQEEDAKQANKYRYSKHEPAQPLFTENDALRALTQLQPIGYEKTFDLGASAVVRLPAGRPPARLGLRPGAGRRRAPSCSAATSGATAGRCCRTRRRSRTPTSCWSNRPTAIACTRPTTTASGWPR